MLSTIGPSARPRPLGQAKANQGSARSPHLRPCAAVAKTAVVQKMPAKPRLTFVGVAHAGVWRPQCHAAPRAIAPVPQRCDSGRSWSMVQACAITGNARGAAPPTPLRAADGMSSGKVTWAERFPKGGLPPPPITRSDDEFLQLGVEFRTSRDGIKVTELNELFDKVRRRGSARQHAAAAGRHTGRSQPAPWRRRSTPLNPPSAQVGFPRRDPERLKVALENTHRMVWVRAVKQSRVARLGQLLGFARATRCAGARRAARGGAGPGHAACAGAEAVAGMPAALWGAISIRARRAGGVCDFAAPPSAVHWGLTTPDPPAAPANPRTHQPPRAQRRRVQCDDLGRGGVARVAARGAGARDDGAADARPGGGRDSHHHALRGAAGEAGARRAGFWELPQRLSRVAVGCTRWGARPALLGTPGDQQAALRSVRCARMATCGSGSARPQARGRTTNKRFTIPRASSYRRWWVCTRSWALRRTGQSWASRGWRSSAGAPSSSSGSWRAAGGDAAHAPPGHAPQRVPGRGRCSARTSTPLMKGGRVAGPLAGPPAAASPLGMYRAAPFACASGGAPVAPAARLSAAAGLRMRPTVPPTLHPLHIPWPQGPFHRAHSLQSEAFFCRLCLCSVCSELPHHTLHGLRQLAPAQHAPSAACTPL